MSRRQAFLFYWWYPDPLIAAADADIVQFPDPGTSCLGSHANSPFDSHVNCSEAKDKLTNLLNKNVSIDSDLFHFFSRIKMGNDMYDNLMKLHKFGGGELDARQV